MMKTRSRSAQPPAKPEMSPSGTPMKVEKITDSTTTSSAVRAPQITRDKMS